MAGHQTLEGVGVSPPHAADRSLAAPALQIQLGFQDIADMNLLSQAPVGSARFEKAIHDFVMRGARQRGHEQEGYTATVRYFDALASGFEHTHHFSPELASQVHECLISRWHKHVCETLGRTLGSESRLVAVLDDIITHAEGLGGCTPPAYMKLALHNAISRTEYPATPDSETARPAATGQDDQAIVEPMQVDDDVRPPENKMLEMPDAPAPGVATATTSATASAESKNVHNACSDEKELRSYFMHHAMQAKKTASKAPWKQEGVKSKARQDARAEWSRMDMQTRSTWQGMFTNHKLGDKRALSPQYSRDMFSDGVASNVWINNASPESSAPQDEGSEGAPLRHAVFPPRCQRYRKVLEPGKTNFLPLEGSQLSSPQLADRCRKALSLTKIERVTDIGYDDIRVLDRSVFVIRWGNAKTAALFEDTMVKTAKADQPRVRAQRYPENATQMFVAHMNQCGDEGIRLDAIFPSLVQAVGGFPFHLRHERLGHSTDTVWLVVFETAPELLRFTVGLQHRGNDHRETAFEPVMKSAACVVCHGAHIAADCPELVRARRAELGLEKRAAGYLNKMPEVVV